MVSATREIAAGAGQIFELIADPAAQPRWDGNDNLASAPAGQRVRRPGDVFAMTLTRGEIRENHVVEFEEGRRIAWTPAEPGRCRRGTCGGGSSSRSTRPGHGLPIPTTGPG